MNCPECKKGTVAFCQDAIIPFKLIKKKNGYGIGDTMTKKINYLDNTWLECSGCNATSDSDYGSYSEKLKEIYDGLL